MNNTSGGPCKRGPERTRPLNSAGGWDINGVNSKPEGPRERDVKPRRPPRRGPCAAEPTGPIGLPKGCKFIMNTPLMTISRYESRPATAVEEEPR